MSALRASNLCFDHPGVAKVIDGVDLELACGELALVIGPNGAGKTTLFGLLAGVLRPRLGRVEVLGRELRGLRPKERARLVGWVPQGLPAIPAVRVRDFVRGGRYPHGGPLGRAHPEDARAVGAALDEADVAEHAERPLGELSGGQLQRVLVARALAQEAPLLLFDEPTASLDPEHQVRVLALVAELAARGRTALVATHDLPLASRYAGRIVVLHRGQKVADGPPAEILRPPVLEPVFGPDLAFLAPPAGAGGASPLVLPWPRPRAPGNGARGEPGR